VVLIHPLSPISFLLKNFNEIVFFGIFLLFFSVFVMQKYISLSGNTSENCRMASLSKLWTHSAFSLVGFANEAVSLMVSKLLGLLVGGFSNFPAFSLVGPAN
jgi:hypothetical protein